MSQSWEDTLCRARGGDEAALGALWRSLNPALLRYLSVRDPAHCEDLASETWLQVVRDLPRFSGNAEDFRRWLFSVARNRSVDALRWRRRQPPVVPEPLPDVVCGNLTEVAAVERLSTAEAIRLIRGLPRDQADVVALRMIADLDVHTTAALLGKSTGAVRVLCHRGLKTLAGQLQPMSRVSP